VADIDRARHVHRLAVTMPLGQVGQQIIDCRKVSGIDAARLSVAQIRSARNPVSGSSDQSSPDSPPTSSSTTTPPRVSLNAAKTPLDVMKERGLRSP